MRAFIALPLPEDMAGRLAAAQAALPVGRATAPDSLHVTLCFLGDAPDPLLADLDLLLQNLRAPRPVLRVSGFGQIEARDQVLLAADLHPDPALVHIQARVETAARQAGCALPRRRFRPHVTLMRRRGRLRPNQADRLAAWIAAHAPPRLPPAEADEMTLYASHLGPHGAVHEPLASYPLG